MAITVNGTNGFTTDNGALKLDTDTLVVDDTNNRVGVGTTSPSAKLDVYNSATAAQNNEILRLRYNTSTTAGHSGDVNFTNSSGTAVGRVSSVIQDGNNVALGFSTYSTTLGERMRIDGSGRVTMPYQPAFYAYGTGVQYWSGTSAHQTLQLNTQASLGSRSTGYNTSTYTFTAPVAGTYVFFGRVTQQTTVTGPALFLYKNGVQVANELSIGYSTAYMTNGGFQLVQLAANDAVTLSLINYNNTSITIDLTRAGFAGWLLG